ncbi:MAG: hypothetical protein LCH61_18090, partial [Proteobacteria bacterium]|nr:hypothetical protein [Pseudomonadota bacterium]
MKRFFNQSGLLARLLVMITLVIAPILLATLLVANSQYRQNIALIENGRKQLTSSFAVRSAIWLNGGARTLLATYATLAAGRQDNATCSASIMAAILANSDYRAALATLPDGRICLGSTEPSLTQQDLERIAALETGVASAAPLTKPEGAVPNYETLIWNGRPLVLIRLSVPAKHGPGGTALLLADGDAIETIFDSPRPGEAEFALIHRDGAMIARRALPDSGEDWLPADPPVLTGYSRFSGLDRSGSKAEFAMMPVAGTPFAVATRLSTHRTDEAWRQYVIMTVAPIIVAFMLLAAYVTGLKRDVLRWIMGLKGAA